MYAKALRDDFCTYIVVREFMKITLVVQMM